MKKIILNLFLFVAVLLPLVSEARIYILIDQAGEKKFPIALPGFVNSEGKSSSAGKKFYDLIIKDLEIASMFQIVDDSKLPQRDSDTTTINFDKWKAIEVGALIKGVVDNSDGGTRFQMRIYDVNEKQMIMGKQYIVDGKNYVDAAHRFVDSLMEALTGTRGPFESRIVGSCGKAMKRTLGWFEMDSMRSGGVGGGAGINKMSPSWSPDGSRVAYSAYSGKSISRITGMEIFVDGRQVTNLNSTSITPAWAPDGGSLIIASNRGGSNTDLYQVGLGGNIIRQITREPSIDFNPSVSGDGRIVFSSERSGGLQLFSTGLGGGGGAQLTYTGYQNDQPDWAPDGSKIVFSSRDRGTFDIFVMDSDGSNIQRVTREEGSNEAPTFAPDSRYIAWASSTGGVYVTLVDGSGEKTLIEKSGGCVNLDWGPWLSKE